MALCGCARVAPFFASFNVHVAFTFPSISWRAKYASKTSRGYARRRTEVMLLRSSTDLRVATSGAHGVSPVSLRLRRNATLFETVIFAGSRRSSSNSTTVITHKASAYGATSHSALAALAMDIRWTLIPSVTGSGFERARRGNQFQIRSFFVIHRALIKIFVFGGAGSGDRDPLVLQAFEQVRTP
jgi:hypothetical protein